MSDYCSLYKKLNHHWNDRIKAKEDFDYFINLKDELLTSLSFELNNIHKKKFSNKIWDIIIGYWLFKFIVVTYDRWFFLKNNINNISDKSLHKTPLKFIPIDSLEATNFFFDEKWNDIFFNYLHNEILKLSNSIDLNTKQYDSKIIQNLNKFNLFISIKRIFKIILNLILSKFDNSIVDYALISSNLSKKNLFKIIIKLPGKKFINFGSLLNLNKIYQVKKRNFNVPEKLGRSEFERILIKIIPTWIPMSYIENFTLILSHLNSSGIYPKKVKTIFSANEHFNNDINKIWFALKVNQGSKLIIGQHGGGPFNKFNGGTSYELGISDLYLSTGNGNIIEKKIIDLGQFFFRLNKNRWKKNGKLILITSLMPQFFFDLRSMCMANQMINYFKDQFIFYKKLIKTIQNETIVRIPVNDFNNDYGWNIKDKWITQFKDVDIQNSKKPLSKILNTCRLVVVTYASTVHNETLAANIPTIIYWDRNNWELNDSSEKDIDNLISVGIFHETPESAANFINDHWNEILNWWSSPLVQKARKNYCRKYAYLNNDVNTKLVNILKNV